MDEMLKSPCSEDFTDFELIRHEANWGLGYKEYDFKCKIDGEETVVHLLMQRHDDGYGFTIRTDENDIYERMSRQELIKLEDKLQGEVQYGLYHEKILKLKSLDDCGDLEFELMENNNVYLNKALRRLWTELSEKKQAIREMEKTATKDVSKKAKSQEL